MRETIMRAAIDARFGSALQSGASIEGQVRHCKTLIECETRTLATASRQNWGLVAIKADEGDTVWRCG